MVEEEEEEEEEKKKRRLSGRRRREEEKTKRDKTSADDNSDDDGSSHLHEDKHRRRKSSSPSRRRNGEDQNSYRDREVKSNSPRRSTSRKKSSKSQTTYHSFQSIRDPQPGKAMEALNDIDGYYVYLNRKYHKKIEELTEKCELQQIRINQLEARGRDQRERVVDAERKNSRAVSQQTSLLFQITRLERKSEDLEAAVKRVTRDYDELEMKYGDQVDKEKRTRKRLDKALEKIKVLENRPKGGISEKEKQIEEKRKRDQQIIEEKDKEIQDLKITLSKLQRKSISIRNELRSVDARNRK